MVKKNPVSFYTKDSNVILDFDPYADSRERIRMNMCSQEAVDFLNRVHRDFKENFPPLLIDLSIDALPKEAVKVARAYSRLPLPLQDNLKLELTVGKNSAFSNPYDLESPFVDDAREFDFDKALTQESIDDMVSAFEDRVP